MSFATGNDLIRYLIAIGERLANGMNNPKAPTTAKTANYTIDKTTDPSGATFTNRGAVGAVTFTLPAPAADIVGTAYRFMGFADQTFTVSAGAGLAVTVNSAASASLACSTSSQKIGAMIEARCDGTSWFLQGVTVGITYTAA